MTAANVPIADRRLNISVDRGSRPAAFERSMIVSIGSRRLQPTRPCIDGSQVSIRPRSKYPCREYFDHDRIVERNGVPEARVNP